VSTSATTSEAQSNDLEVMRTRHTGFTNEAFDSDDFNSSNCLAIGWGHLSRVWTVRFLEASPCNGSLLLQSAGEDATARTWELTPNSGGNAAFPYKLLELDCAGHHSGKNMWSTVVSGNPKGMQQVIAGGADSKVTATPLFRVLQAQKNLRGSIAEYTINDILARAQVAEPIQYKSGSTNGPQSSKKAEFFRTYCFVDETSFLLTTNSGNVLIGTLSSDTAQTQSSLLANSALINQLDDLSGYSVCTSGSRPGLAYVAGGSGNIYVYCKESAVLTNLHTVGSKVGDIFASELSEADSPNMTALLVTLVGQGEAQLLYVDPERHTDILRVMQVPIAESTTGSVITSMTHARVPGRDFVIVGFRRGSIALYDVHKDEEGADAATLLRIIEKAHGGEAVTSLIWRPSSGGFIHGHLFSAGRDGRLIVHQLDSSAHIVELVHDLALPFGPNIEGLYFQDDHLFIHGFSSKKWYLYDVTNEEEVMSIDTGGAHRSWAFRPHSSVGGTLVWTRASSMHICSQNRSNHTVIRRGGHGREIKAVAITSDIDSRPRQLIATGAEDTDIKIFHYVEEELTCRRTIRKHTTGIQHLQWSQEGDYLFSSGGCEECKALV
jgi:WD40 repeat protein